MMELKGALMGSITLAGSFMSMLSFTQLLGRAQQAGNEASTAVFRSDSSN